MTTRATSETRHGGFACYPCDAHNNTHCATCYTDPYGECGPLEQSILDHALPAETHKPETVAECWQHVHKGLAPTILRSEAEADKHRNAGHDVRPVRWER